MDLLRTLVAVAALAGSACHAGYAQLATPPGFTNSSYGWGYAASANDATFGRVLHQPNGLTANVAGQTVKMPASYRLAANAPRIAAAVIFANPYVRAGAGIATWLGISKVIWDAASGTWRQITDPKETGGTVWYYEDIPQGFPDADAACKAGYDKTIANKDAYPYAGPDVLSNGTQANCRYRYKSYPNWDPVNFGSARAEKTTGPRECPPGWTQSPAGCLSPQLTQPEMVELLNPANQPGWPMPSTVPLELPKPTTLPVEQPFINPAPGSNPAHRPQFIPTGNPVRNPNYDPNAAPGPNNSPWLQPGVRMVPSPTPSEPFRVDYQPVNRPVDSPDPNPEPSPDGDDNPDDKPNSDEQLSLCEKHPDIVACQKLGDLTPETLKSKTVTLDLKREDGFGPSNGSCPAPKQFVVLGKSMAFRWDLFCDFASAIRPLLIGFAYLSAALAFMGLSRKD